ncbi:MAG: hypothetical protein ACYSUQ_15850, partial [Planctomycetota bacterium]
MQTRTWRFVGRTFIPLLGAVFAFQVGPHPAQAGSSWLSKTRQVPRTDGTPAPAPHTEGMPGPAPRADSSTTVFDIVISLYNDPSGDDDPDNDTGTEDQTNYEEIIRFWADSICEQSNGALELGKVRIFRNGIHGSLADVVWNASEWPRAAPSGF